MGMLPVRVISSINSSATRSFKQYLEIVSSPVLVFAIQSLRTKPSGKVGREYKEGDYIPLFANIATLLFMV
ncbi:hypothetical protein CFP56_016155 [Quercus suber]|uniref:Uncharacterized protein n=1 Tax=Quercus suber TaxID=58331 RepID=A0AAW0KQR8_QUESU